VYLFLVRCKQSNSAWLRSLMPSDCLYSFLFFEHYNRVLLCDQVPGRDKHSTRPGLDWIRTIENFVEFGKLFKIQDTGRIWT